jgi:predicted Fe-S protein YdhL (DUF1289 family)
MSDNDQNSARESASSSTPNSLKPDSPCIGYCSTSFGDDVCKGCGRGFMEVINWNTMDDAQKASIWLRVESEATGYRWRKVDDAAMKKTPGSAKP